VKETQVHSFCDNHGEARVPATHVDVEVLVGESGVRKIDLCDGCRDGILGPVEALLPFGTPVEQRRRKPRRTVKQFRCPVEDCPTESVSRKALSTHLRAVHQTSIKDYSTLEPATAQE
jgi:hypothetical protein